MKINGANSVQGMFNFDSSPLGSIYTRHDLVIYNNIIYTCLGESQGPPDITSPDWESYLHPMRPVKN